MKVHSFVGCNQYRVSKVLSGDQQTSAFDCDVRRAELTTAAEARRAMRAHDRDARGAAADESPRGAADGSPLAAADAALDALAAAAEAGSGALLDALVAEAV